MSDQFDLHALIRDLFGIVTAPRDPQTMGRMEYQLTGPGRGMPSQGLPFGGTIQYPQTQYTPMHSVQAQPTMAPQVMPGHEQLDGPPLSANDAFFQGALSPERLRQKQLEEARAAYAKIAGNQLLPPDSTMLEYAPFAKYAAESQPIMDDIAELKKAIHNKLMGK